MDFIYPVDQVANSAPAGLSGVAAQIGCEHAAGDEVEGAGAVVIDQELAGDGHDAL